jgi:hypothetical protein
MKERAMADLETLVQRFLDQELSPEEHMQFVARLGRDEALRRRTIALEQLVLDAGRLPLPVVPDDFVARVMDRACPAPPIWRRLADALWAPRVLEWNMVKAGVAASLLAFAVGGAVAGALSWSKGSGTATDAAAAGPIAAPSTVLVRLVVLQPGARTVQAAGDFNGWNPERTPLEQVSNGAWMATIPLEPGRYEYMLVVDGKQWIADPFALEQSDDGFGSRNAVLEVRTPLDSPL